MVLNLIFKRAIVFFLLVILLPTHFFSQKIHIGLDALSLYPDAKMVRESQFSNLPSYISFINGSEKDIDIIFPWIKKNMRLSNSIGFEFIREETDKLGYKHYRYQETFAGNPIGGAIWILHTKNDKVVSMNGLLYDNLINSGKIIINEQEALNFALQHIGASTYKWQLPGEEEHLKWESNDPKATYYPKGEEVYVADNYQYNKLSYRLAYRFNIYAQKPLSRAEVYVDASTGKILSVNNILDNIDTPGTASTVYSGTRTIITDDTGGNFRLRETGRGNGIRTFNMNTGTNYGSSVDFIDADNIWNNINAQFDEYATDAHWGAEMTFDYLSNIHGRNSIDNAGFQLNSYVHYDVAFANAFWDGTRMTYGDGSSGTPYTALDIAGHEISHGLTTFTANLAYQAESGALNESFSDIFGTSVENYARPSNWNWTIGEDLGGAFRSMSNPNAFGDPDTYFGTNWASLTGADNGGVHTNSGVQNYWYYLLTMGGSGTNDNANTYNITGLGFASSSAIAFRNLTVYLTANSQYSDAGFYAIQSAIDLFGACSAEVEQTTNAWYAVGVGSIYNPTVIAGFSAPYTTSCSAPFTVNFVNQSNNASTSTWDFGDGTTSTQNNPSHVYTSIGTFDVKLSVDGGTCGSDSITLTAYIDIDTNLPCVVNFPTGGSADLQTACTGTIFDSGGPAANYGANQDAQITISPSGAATVDLNFTFFDIEPGTGASCDYDYLDVFDGANTGAPLLGKYCNNNIPTVLSSTGGSITLVFHSDPGLELAGFQIDWSCNLPVTPPIADFTSNVSTTCTGSVNYTDLSSNGPTSWAWDFGDGTTSSLQNPTHLYTSNGTYTVILTSTNANGSDVSTKINYIVVNMPAAPTTTDDAICENNTATLGASGANTLNWYDAPSGGNLVATGTSYTTPILTTTTSYYVEEEIPAALQYVGPLNNGIGTGGYFVGDQHLVFDCSTPFILRSVWVDANNSGNRTIELRDNVGTVIQSITVNIPAGQSRVTLNFNVPVGSNLQLGTLSGSSPDLYRNNAGPIFPYTISGIVSITASSAGTGFYYHFYDWEIQEYSCISSRTLVTANVSPISNATITPVGPFCTSDANITLTAVDPGGTWSGIGVSGTTFSPSLAGTGNHLITYTIPGACGSSATETISVSGAFNATITSTTGFCTGDTAIYLTATDAGGIWSGAGITNSINGIFDPTVAGVGTHTIIYTIAGGCGDIDSISVVVNDVPDASFTAPNLVCITSGLQNFNATVTGGTWSSDCGICIDPNLGIFDPAMAGVGTWAISYSVTSLASCTGTNNANIIVDPCTDINESENGQISIYPNPSNDFLTISTGNLEHGIIEISDLLGKRVLRTNFNNYKTTIYIGQYLSKGNYLISVLSGDGVSVAVKKFIKN